MVEIREPEKVKSQIVGGMRSYFKSAGHDRAVLGISGGLDSSVTLSLTAEALPQTTCDKPSSPRLWPGHLAEKELGVNYETVDEFIHLHLDEGMSIDEASAKMGTPVAVLRALQTRMSVTAHKRALPPTMECDPF